MSFRILGLRKIVIVTRIFHYNMSVENQILVQTEFIDLNSYMGIRNGKIKLTRSFQFQQ